MGTKTAKRSTRGGSSRALRYAVIGQGYISQMAVLPAFVHARRNSRLSALVSGDPQKLKLLGRKYGVDRLCSYSDVDALFGSGEVDAVYIALPNSMHLEYTVRAARAGLHVLCEKPMAVRSSDCERMNAETAAAGVKLMIAYRLHFERANLEAVKLARSGRLGDLKFFSAQFSMQMKDKDNIRLSRELGGGPLSDIGIYCLNAARMLFRDEPVSASAVQIDGGDSRFHEVPETVAATLEFEGGRVATFVCSFGATDTSAYQLVGNRGSLHMEPAFDYATGLGYVVRRGDRKSRRKFAGSDQFAPELLYFSDCILKDRDPEPSGREGLADVRVIEALERSMAIGQSVEIPRLAPEPRHPNPDQALRRPPVRKPALVHACAPRGESR